MGGREKRGSREGERVCVCVCVCGGGGGGGAGELMHSIRFLCKWSRTFLFFPLLSFLCVCVK